jgi:hypothetical protein
VRYTVTNRATREARERRSQPLADGTPAPVTRANPVHTLLAVAAGVLLIFGVGMAIKAADEASFVDNSQTVNTSWVLIVLGLAAAVAAYLTRTKRA